ncbi:DMT family transporter [Nocardioides daeguensis]|nr:multidrug efflux SMR transporter [Nocardioides daeguensis]MBV6728802.1 multidrug efflux SMR transporter [Nocardioides daeguensis]MCR1773588.1 multidrug efflux SMR transporter [Nocardioides daeguensis]
MWVWLGVAIVTEVTATLSLRQSQGFTQLLPSIVVVCGYSTAFYALAQALKNGMTVATAYAIWCGVGIALIAALSAVLFDEWPSALQVAGLVLVTIGIVTVQLGSA